MIFKKEEKTYPIFGNMLNSLCVNFEMFPVLTFERLVILKIVSPGFIKNKIFTKNSEFSFIESLTVGWQWSILKGIFDEF